MNNPVQSGHSGQSGHSRCMVISRARGGDAHLLTQHFEHCINIKHCIIIYYHEIHGLVNVLRSIAVGELLGLVAHIIVTNICISRYAFQRYRHHSATTE